MENATYTFVSHVSKPHVVPKMPRYLSNKFCILNRYNRTLLPYCLYNVHVCLVKYLYLLNKHISMKVSS